MRLLTWQVFSLMELVLKYLRIKHRCNKGFSLSQTQVNHSDLKFASVKFCKSFEFSRKIWVLG
jgi:hypothetical protein